MGYMASYMLMVISGYTGLRGLGFRFTVKV